MPNCVKTHFGLYDLFVRYTPTYPSEKEPAVARTATILAFQPAVARPTDGGGAN